MGGLREGWRPPILSTAAGDLGGWAWLQEATAVGVARESPEKPGNIQEGGMLRGAARQPGATQPREFLCVALAEVTRRCQEAVARRRDACLA